MTPTYTAAVFTLSFLISAWAVSRHLRGPATILSRVLEPGKEKPAGLRSLSWSRILAWIGSLQKSGGQQKLRADFMRAGIRSPRADTVFRGLKIVAAAVGGIAAGAGRWRRGVNPTRAANLAGVDWRLGRLLPGAAPSHPEPPPHGGGIEKALPTRSTLSPSQVEAGLGLDQAIIQVSRELRVAHPEISDELSMTSLEMRAGKRRADALGFCDPDGHPGSEENCPRFSFRRIGSGRASRRCFACIRNTCAFKHARRPKRRPPNSA